MPAAKLVLGTHNIKKARELIELLTPWGFDVRTLAEFPSSLEVEEDGDSFAANARKKAIEQAKHLGYMVLGEDSGLCVDALNGRPGVHSARYSGPKATDASNNAKLLQELGNTPLIKRTAHYVCHIAVADSQGSILAEAVGKCRGGIRFQAAGTNGFGYDPLFEILEYHHTFGELGPMAKACLSHRARAVAQIIPHLVKLAGAGKWM